MKHKSDYIYFTERNIHGAWVVYGVDGVKQYYDYTKKETEEKYIADCNIIKCKKA